jgi:hypothetical protein
MSEVTRILSAIEGGDPRAADQFLPLVYDELRRHPAPLEGMNSAWTCLPQERAALIAFLKTL